MHAVRDFCLLQARHQVGKRVERKPCGVVHRELETYIC